MPHAGQRLVEGWVDFLNEGAPATASATLSPSFVDHDPVPGHEGTFAGTVRAAERLRSDELSVAFTLEDCFGHADRVAFRVSAFGTVRDDTGAAVEMFMLSCAGVFRIEDGLLRERWGAWAYLPVSRRDELVDGDIVLGG